MKIFENVLEAVGNTPLIRLNKLVAPGMATVLVKVEYMNPGAAIKDRMAIYMAKQGERDGKLKPNGTIVENTSGNTGFALGMVAAVKGYRAIFTIPDKNDYEKINMMKAMGADVIVCPTNVDHDAHDSYTETAKRLAEQTENSFYVDQYNAPANIQAHYETTGPEIWRDTEGKVDAFVTSAGTGGTITGVGRYLKEQAKAAGKEVKIVCPDPEGSIFYDYFLGRDPEPPKAYRVEGIGNDALVGCLDFSIIDEMFKVNDRQAFLTARRLAREEGLFCGGSSGLNVFAALKVAKQLGPGKTVVTILCDTGAKYISKQFNDEWMTELGFLETPQASEKISDIVAFQKQKLMLAKPNQKISEVARIMREKGISQLPVEGEGPESHLMVHEMDLLKNLVEEKCKGDDLVSSVATSLRGQVGANEPISRLEEIFARDNVAVVVDGPRIKGVITKIDLVSFLTSQA